VEGWRESDYLDYADFEDAIENDEQISFALCQWFMRQSHGTSGDAFTDEEWKIGTSTRLSTVPDLRKNNQGVDKKPAHTLI
jgi:hypothetical protein